MNREEALEAAKLAAMVGGQLKAIDSHYMERRNMPANRININNFIDQVKDPRRKTPTASYLSNTPQGFAPPPPEEFVQNQVPEIQASSNIAPPPPISQPESIPIPAPIPAPAPIPEPVNVGSINFSPSSSQPSIKEKIDVSSKLEKEFLKTLKSIDKTLSNMLAYMKENLSK